MISCSKCKHENPDNNVFCELCGSSLMQTGSDKVICSSCGKPNTTNAIFCANCGVKLVEKPQSKSAEKLPKGSIDVVESSKKARKKISRFTKIFIGLILFLGFVVTPLSIYLYNEHQEAIEKKERLAEERRRQRALENIETTLKDDLDNIYDVPVNTDNWSYKEVSDGFVVNVYWTNDYWLVKRNYHAKLKYDYYGKYIKLISKNVE